MHVLMKDYKSLTLPNGTRLIMICNIFAIVAGTLVYSPYLSLILFAALASDLVSSRVPSNSPNWIGLAGRTSNTAMLILVTLAGIVTSRNNFTACRYMSCVE